MAVNLGSTFKELIDEINSKSVIDSIDGLKGGTLSSPLIVSGGDGVNASKIALTSAGKGQITDGSTGTLFGFMRSDILTVGNNGYTTNIRGNANSTIGGKKFSDLAIKSDIPDTSDYVKLTTDQTISGTKTFTSGSIVASKTDSSKKTMKVSYGCNGIAYTPYGTTSIHLISFPAKDGTFALTSDIPSLTNYVTTDTSQVISGVKTFNAPTNVSGSETITTKFKTSNGGALIIGKEGQNSGTMLRFDQVDGTCRLRFRSSATAGSMVWEQPEKNAALYFDMGNSTGSGKNRVTLRNVAGTLALTKEIPAAVSANPALSGSEAYLTGLQIGSTKYKIPSGGGGGGSGGCTLDDLEAEYKEGIENEDIENVNAVPVLDVENTGYWTMVPVSELGGGGGSGKKYYNHHITITITQTTNNITVRKDIIFNIVSTIDIAFTKNNIYLHLRKDQLCICKITTSGSYVKDEYSAYISDYNSTTFGASLIGGEYIISPLSGLGLTDIVTLISDL